MIGDASGSDPSDEVLLRRHVDGDREAFGALARRHQDRLWAVALRTTGNPEDAADAVQDGLISAMRAAANFRGEARVTTWLHRIVVNACLDLMRRSKVRPTGILPDDERLPPDPRDDFAEQEVASDVGAALARLPVEQRVALVLVDVEGYPVQEAADMLSVPVGTVKSRCARGRARLAPMLAHLRNRPPSTSVPSSPAATGEEEPS